jgi:hypothetical protein
VAITELAEGTDAEHLGELIGFFGIPLAGLILLIVVLVPHCPVPQRRPRRFVTGLGSCA